MTGVQDGSYPDISFAGCGFIGIYHVGVSACLSAYAPSFSSSGFWALLQVDLKYIFVPHLQIFHNNLSQCWSLSLCSINLVW